MPRAPCKALNSYQMVVGVDLHDQIPPIPPVPGPHVVIACMGWAPADSSKVAATVKAGWGRALARQHDIGSQTLHLALNLLLPIVVSTASNKAEFGASTVRLPTGRMAASSGDPLLALLAVPMASGLSLQLDCNVPCPWPTSRCFALFNTVLVGLTGADLLGGYAAMVADIVIGFLLEKAASHLVGLTNSPLRRILARLGEGIALIPVVMATEGFPLVVEVAKVEATNVTQSVLTWLFGRVGLEQGPVNNGINEFIAPSPSPKQRRPS